LNKCAPFAVAILCSLCKSSFSNESDKRVRIVNYFIDEDWRSQLLIHTQELSVLCCVLLWKLNVTLFLFINKSTKISCTTPLHSLIFVHFPQIPNLITYPHSKGSFGRVYKNKYKIWCISNACISSACISYASIISYTLFGLMY